MSNSALRFDLQAKQSNLSDSVVSWELTDSINVYRFRNIQATKESKDPPLLLLMI